MKKTAKNKNTENNITEMVFILDRSGSMAGLEADTIGGFNSMIKDQKKEDGAAYVTTVLFDTEFIRLHDRIDISKVTPMTDSDYVPRGCTALLDAVGDTISHIEAIHKYVRQEDVPSKTIFIITTDGMENASKKYDSRRIKQLISEAREKKGWEFIFLGANIDAAETAESIGIERERASNYKASGKGTKHMFGALNQAVCCMRANAPLCENWNEQLEADASER